MRVFRLEFLQPPSMRTRWLGPYSAKWLTAEGEELTTYLEAEHIRTRPHPVNTPLLKASTFENRYLCGCDSRTALSDWFGKYFGPLREQGGQVGVYEGPDLAVAEHLNGQVVLHHGLSRIIERDGHPAAAPLVLTSAGSRRAKIAAAASKYGHCSPASPGVITSPAATDGATQQPSTGRNNAVPSGAAIAEPCSPTERPEDER